MSNEQREITVVEDSQAVAREAAERVIQAATAAVEDTGRFVFVLAGGSTPRALYRQLVEPEFRERMPWGKTLFLFGDERCVGPDDEQSNYRMARETLFEPAGVPARQVLRMEGELSPIEAATRYLLRVRDLYVGEIRPPFDLVLLGLGTDGHTASLFPGTGALAEKRRWVAANEVPRLDAWRLTMTLPALNSARRVLFLVTGEAKTEIVGRVFGETANEPPYPSELVLPDQGTLEVLLDRAAAGGMPGA